MTNICGISSSLTTTFNLKKNGATYWVICSAIISAPNILTVDLKGLVDANATEAISSITTSLPVDNSNQKLVFNDAELQPIIQDIINSLFDEVQATNELLALFVPKMVTLAPYWGLLSTLMDSKNFAGISVYIGGLLQSGVLVQSDVDAIKQVFANQSINI